VYKDGKSYNDYLSWRFVYNLTPNAHWDFREETLPDFRRMPIWGKGVLRTQLPPPFPLSTLHSPLSSFSLFASWKSPAEWLPFSLPLATNSRSLRAADRFHYLCTCVCALENGESQRGEKRGWGCRQLTLFFAYIFTLFFGPSSGAHFCAFMLLFICKTAVEVKIRRAGRWGRYSPGFFPALSLLEFLLVVSPAPFHVLAALLHQRALCRAKVWDRRNEVSARWKCPIGQLGAENSGSSNWVICAAWPAASKQQLTHPLEMVIKRTENSTEEAKSKLIIIIVFLACKSGTSHQRNK